MAFLQRFHKLPCRATSGSISNHQEHLEEQLSMQYRQKHFIAFVGFVHEGKRYDGIRSQQPTGIGPSAFWVTDYRASQNKERWPAYAFSERLWGLGLSFRC